MNKQKNFKIQALILSLFLISLDAYSLFSIPLQWIGLSFLSLFLLINLKFIETRFNSILYIFGTLLFLPILFEIISCLCKSEPDQRVKIYGSQWDR